DNTSRNVIFEVDSVSYAIPFSEFVRESKKLFNGIKSGSGSSFILPDMNAFISKMKIINLKAGSRQKGDLILKIHDPLTSADPTLEFSVKSYIGNKATLLNSSKTGTKIDYVLSSNISNEKMLEINSINTRKKLIDR